MRKRKPTPSFLVRRWSSVVRQSCLTKFVDPFDGTDLSTISDDTVDALNVMRELAEDAETKLFNPQIAAASGATGMGLGPL